MAGRSSSHGRGNGYPGGAAPSNGGPTYHTMAAAIAARDAQKRALEADAWWTQWRQAVSPQDYHEYGGCVLWARLLGYHRGRGG